MTYNKVKYNGTTLIDLTSDTVTPEYLAEGYTAHNAAGEPITGTMVAGGGNDIADKIVTRTITEFSSSITYTGQYAFHQCYELTSIDLPECTSVGRYSFYNCRKLTSFNLPKLKDISYYSFYGCSDLTSITFANVEIIYDNGLSTCRGLTSINLPKCKSLRSYAFDGCTNLTSVILPVCADIYSYVFSGCIALTSIDLPACKSIESRAFRRCSALTSITLRSSTVCTLSNTNAFDSSGITSTSGAIYVPANLVESYKTATNWSSFADIIQAIPEVTT